MSRKRSGDPDNHPVMSKKSTGLSTEGTDEVDVLFNKKFKYTGWMTPDKFKKSDTTSQFCVEDFVGDKVPIIDKSWRDEKLIILKDNLNGVKDQLSSHDIETWHKHTTDCNLAGKILPYVKSLDVELCTQAWVKFYEMLNSHSIVPDVDFLSVHLCEAPGAFITALNHYLCQHGVKQEWDWLATTLCPYYEANSLAQMVADDRLIRLTYPRWFFGEDGSGDIMVPGHISSLCRAVEERNKLREMPTMLVTADGSKDCQENPAEQEAMLARLHYCEMVAACLILEKKGCFVLKVFTMFEGSSVTLMFLLNVMFEEVNMMKPATSKSGNSETYLVCRSYRKNVKSSTLWNIAESVVYNPKDMFLDVPDIPESFIQEHRLCCESFTQWQVESISRNIALFANKSETALDRLEQHQELALDTYLRLTGVQSRKHMSRVGITWRERSAFCVSRSTPSSKLWSDPMSCMWIHKRLKGTFHLRKNLSSMCFKERLQLMDVRDISPPDSVLSCSIPLEDGDLDYWSGLDCGARLTQVHNSRLCNITLVEDYNMMLTHCQINKHQQDTVEQHTLNLGEILSAIVSENCSALDEGWKRSPIKRDEPASGAEWAGSEPSVVYMVRDCESSQQTGGFSSVTDMLKGRKGVCVQEINKDSVEDLQKCSNGALVFCDVTGFLNSNNDPPTNFTEISVNRKFLTNVWPVLKVIPRGCSLVLLTSTFLTRLSATLLYLVSRMFDSTSFKCEPNVWLNQFVILTGYHGLCRGVDQHMTDMNQRLIDEDKTGQNTNCVMELYPFIGLLSDRKFVQVVMEHNNFAVAGFVNKLLELDRQS